MTKSLYGKWYNVQKSLFVLSNYVNDLVIHDVFSCIFNSLMIATLQGWVFLFSLLGITPLAERLGYATE